MRTSCSISHTQMFTSTAIARITAWAGASVAFFTIARIITAIITAK